MSGTKTLDHCIVKTHSFEKEVYDKFIAYCKANKKNASALMRSFIWKYLKDKGVL